MKRKGIAVLLVCMVILGGCSTRISQPDSTMNSNTVESKPISAPNLSTLEGIKEYLTGDWVCSITNKSNVVLKMRIDEKQNVDLSFYDLLTDEAKADYKGKISLNRIHAKQDQAPDMISFELTDTVDTGGKFLFLHRTVYDGKRVMGLFFVGNLDSVFNLLATNDDPEDERVLPDEIICEKVSGEKQKLTPRKNQEFYAVYWGMDAKKESLWLDDVRWTPPNLDYAAMYPEAMTLYENDVTESVLYDIVEGSILYISEDDMTKGRVYLVTTDEAGNLIDVVNADNENHPGSILNDEAKTQALIFEFVRSRVKEIREQLDMGMKILFDGGTTTIDGKEYYVIAVGTDHEEHFVREDFYAVNLLTEQVYRDDILMNKWVPVAVE